MGGKVGENPAALRAAVFFVILEKPEGGGGAFKRPPPPAGRGIINVPSFIQHFLRPWASEEEVGETRLTH